MKKKKKKKRERRTTVKFYSCPTLNNSRCLLLELNMLLRDHLHPVDIMVSGGTSLEASDPDVVHPHDEDSHRDGEDAEHETDVRHLQIREFGHIFESCGYGTWVVLAIR
jgi:hypothetical protein